MVRRLGLEAATERHVSGKKSHRTGLDKLMAAARRRKVDAVLV